MKDSTLGLLFLGGIAFLATRTSNGSVPAAQGPSEIVASSLAQAALGNIRSVYGDETVNALVIAQNAQDAFNMLAHRVGTKADYVEMVGVGGDGSAVANRQILEQTAMRELAFYQENVRQAERELGKRESAHPGVEWYGVIDARNQVARAKSELQSFYSSHPGVNP